MALKELTISANELLYRDFINIMGKYNYLRAKNFKIFVSFVVHDFPVIKYRKMAHFFLQLLESSISLRPGGGTPNVEVIGMLLVGNIFVEP